MSQLTSGVKNVILHPDKKNPSLNRGYAFIEYRTHREAAMARKALLPGNVKIWDTKVTIDWADPDPMMSSRDMNDDDGQQAVLHLGFLNPDCTEDQIKYHFEFGRVLQVWRVKKIRKFAFVQYTNRANAEKAMRLSKSNFLT